MARAKATTRGEDLYQLQQLDSEKDAVERRLTEVETALGESQALVQAREAVAEGQRRYQKHTLRQRDLELQVQSVTAKIRASEQRLYGGNVKNPKELTDLQAEIASLRRRQEKLEDTLLEVMIAREETEGMLEQAQKHLQQVEAAWQTAQADLMTERHALQEKRAELEQAIAALLPRISTDDVETYRDLRRRKGGLAVVEAQGKEDSCGACGMAISPGLKWQLREEGVGYCTNCERILVRLR
ncbi:MAG TPA: hypothetical protein ENF52_06155 [Chloroflexi bacterium]|nr:hypothetical protein [Chloroflexota bacterium]